MRIARVIDLSHVVMISMPVFPGDQKPTVRHLSTVKEMGYRLSKITLGSHTGTHIDAPSHMIEDGVSADKISLDKLVGEAVVLDMTYINPGEAIVPLDLQKHAVKEGDIVLLCTTMGRRWGTQKILTDYPYLSLDAAEWLVARGVKAVGVDWLSIEKYGVTTHPVHVKLLSHMIPIIEGLANLDLVKGRRILFICLPLRLKDVDGAPARAVALEMES